MERLRRLHWNERTVPPERARRLTGIRTSLGSSPELPLYNDLRQRPDRSQSHRNTREKTDDCFHIRLLNMAERARGHCYHHENSA